MRLDLRATLFTNFFVNVLCILGVVIINIALALSSFPTCSTITITIL